MAIEVVHGESRSMDPRQAVAELAAAFGPGTLDAVIFFCSPDYVLGELGSALQDTFVCPTTGCTAAGQIGADGFEHTGILGVGFRGGGLRLQPYPITPLADHAHRAVRIAEAVRERGAAHPDLSRFGLLLVDGLSMLEERLVASLYQAVGNMPIVGGSAGDDLRFESTHVYDGAGRFLSDAAVFCLVECDAPIQPMKVQHFHPTATELVITAADPERRIIYEMNGEPAAVAYAEALGLTPDALTAEVFSCHPLVLSFGQEPYVRSVQQIGADMSLTCYCAIEEGLIVTIGAAVDPLETLQTAFSELRRAMPEPALILACDCILRRLEFEGEGIDAAVGRLMAANRVFGFSTYGEQFNGVHVNQTFTAVAIGG
ncbi:histidine kinase [Nitrogeniibacter mangrovi]|uniref:Histidine kinase n=1 Tax=Nitrogeniibacter mangrovi TaxID=2016596 RepID=A0A6C1B883_9RHOO|nr:FIST N-terminal domain-containing protein [Nitrogeniibacter mangrovi]QID18928.1 histidine kinase [Nitrogeniibacter mangrovi]